MRLFLAISIMLAVMVGSAQAATSSAQKVKLYERKAEQHRSTLKFFSNRPWLTVPSEKKCWQATGWHRRKTCRVARREVAEARARLANIKRVIARLTAPPPVDWASVQMHYATLIARSSGGDPWPNCPDPFDGSGSSWYDTLGCENGGNWLDSPGFYRCGLQFDPSWERYYGRRFCP